MYEWLETQYALSRGITEATILWYKNNLAAAERHAGKQLTLGCLSDQLLNGILAAMAKKGLSAEYCRGVRNAVAALWRDAAEQDIIQPPRKLRRIREEKKPVLTWSLEQVGRLMAEAGKLSGKFRNTEIDRAPYFTSLIRMAWDSPLRRRDLHRLTGVDIQPDFVWTQHKTRKPVRVRIRPTTLAAIATLGRRPEALVWPLWATDTAFDQTFKKLVRGAGLPPGPWRTIRASAGTAAEVLCPGSGHLLLGNTRRVFERYYLDASQVAGPQPPELA